jgi:hypothetical protein
MLTNRRKKYISTIASLSTVLGHLSNITGNLPNTELLYRSRRDIEECLDYCYPPEEIQRWHLKKMKEVRANAEYERLNILCTNVALHLLHATQQAALQRWAAGLAILSEDMTARQHLNKALKSIILAFKEFSLVPNFEVLCTGCNMEMVRKYLEMVYEITLVLAEVAFPPDMASQSLGYWTEILDETDLEGFQFDDVDGARRHWIRDRTLGGVLPTADRTPEIYLSSNPSCPVLFRREGAYGPPVLKNALVPRWEEYERFHNDNSRQWRWRTREHD